MESPAQPMFTHADILEQKDGSVVLAIPVGLPDAAVLVLRLRPSSFELLDQGTVIGRVDRVPSDVISALKPLAEVRVLACPEDMDITTARVHRAQVTLVRRAAGGPSRNRSA